MTFTTGEFPSSCSTDASWRKAASTASLSRLRFRSPEKGREEPVKPGVAPYFMVLIITVRDSI
jgi:hypothetical protein